MIFQRKIINEFSLKIRQSPSGGCGVDVDPTEKIIKITFTEELKKKLKTRLKIRPNKNLISSPHPKPLPLSRYAPIQQKIEMLIFCQLVFSVNLSWGGAN